MKRIILSALSVLLILLLVACSGTGASDETTVGTDETTGGAPVDAATTYGGSFEIDRAIWDSSCEGSSYENVTVTLDVTGEDGVLPTSVYRIDGERASLTEAEETRALDATAARELVNCATAILSFYDQFALNGETRVYESIDEIEYGVTVSGYGAIITVWDAEVSFNDSARVSRIACSMRQRATVNDAPFELELQVVFTFSDYGTTVVP